jgi:hypothetical protein
VGVNGFLSVCSFQAGDSRLCSRASLGVTGGVATVISREEKSEAFDE